MTETGSLTGNSIVSTALTNYTLTWKTYDTGINIETRLSLRGKREKLKLGPDPDFSDQSYRIPSIEEIEEIRKRFPAENLPAKIVPSTVIFPEGKTGEDYKNLNIHPGTRVGWETRQEYVEKLGDLYSEGYLTEEEYENRVSWVNESKTRQQIEFVFSDLTVHLVNMKVKDLTKQKSVRRQVFMTPSVSISYILILAVAIILLISGANIGAIFLIGEVIAATLYLIWKTRR